jgi:hypothetical protein
MTSAAVATRSLLLENDGYPCEMVRRALQYHAGEKMSRRGFRRLTSLKLLVFIMALAAMITTISCLNLGESEDERFYGFFLRDMKTMEEMGLPVYWLGREFTAGGLTFHGPYAPEFGGEVEGGGTFFHYKSLLEATQREGTQTDLEITVYSPAAWQLVKDRILNPRTLSTEGEVTRRTVTVKGRQAEVLSVPQVTRPVGYLCLVLDLDEVVVVATARALGPVSPGGPDYSIFINNPDLLVQVMQDLRPYPE